MDSSLLGWIWYYEVWFSSESITSDNCLRNKKLCRSQSFCLFLYLILMGLRAPACHINKARNWIAKPMLVKLAIRNCFWWWWRWWWVKMFWIFNCTCKIYGTEILFSDIVRVFWVDKLIKNWRHIQNINIENLLQIKMSLLRHRRSLKSFIIFTYYFISKILWSVTYITFLLC